MSLFFRDEPRLMLRRDAETVPTATGMSMQQHQSMLTSMRGSSGVQVDADSAMRHDAWFSCVTAIAQDVAMMPVDVLRRAGDVLAEIDPPAIITAPSSYRTDPLDWRYDLVESWLTAGNAWGLVTDTTANHLYPTRIELVNDLSVVRWVEGKRVRFSIDGAEHDLWPVGDLWHSPAYTIPGRLLGLSPVQYHAWTIGKGLAAAKHGLQYFTDGGIPVGVWELAGDPNSKIIQAFKDRVMGLVRGSREPLFVGAETAVYKPIQSVPTDSQFLETERYSVEQICRIFREDPADHGASVGTGGSIIYANRSDADLARLKRRQFWVTKMQNVLSGLIPRPQVVRLNTAASLMMTEMERHELYQVRLACKTITVNEIRIKDDEEPFPDPDYDLPGVPGGLVPVQPKPKADSQPAKAAP